VALPPATAEDASVRETADRYFSPLAPAKHVLLATFTWGAHPGGQPMAYRFRGAQPVHYELRPCGGAGAAGRLPIEPARQARAGVLAAAGGKAARIGRPPNAGWGALARGSMVSTSERISNG
jgi:hypothetical protein